MIAARRSMSIRAGAPRRMAIFVACLPLALMQSGCILGRQHPAATQPSTAINIKENLPDYWLDQPAVVHIVSPNFDKLWNACMEAVQDDGFTTDRKDYREGRLTTLPLPSKQLYEIWKSDVVDPHDLIQASLGTMRRTVHFTIRRLPDGTFQATPKVLVERDSLLERRITSVDQYQNVFSVQTADVMRQNEQTGMDIPAEYWYPVARDTALEKQLARLVKAHLPKASGVAR